MNTWLEASYMNRKGVARGKAGKTHQLTKAVQGEYHYVYGPYAKPVLTIKPGDVVVAETEDAFGGAIKTVERSPVQDCCNMPFVNPQCGPIAVEGAEKGDVLCVSHPVDQAARDRSPSAPRHSSQSSAASSRTMPPRCSTRPCPSGS